MIYVLIILAVACIVLSVLLILQKREIANISRSLQEIRKTPGNRTVHSTGGSKEADELISQINHLLSDLREESSKYRRKRHELDNMMTNISHDLRTPLTSAVGYLDIIRSGGLSKEEEERELKIISERLSRLQELIDSFFEFSRIVSEDRTPSMEPVNLVAVVEESVSGLYDAYEARGRHIEPELGSPRFEIKSNRMMLSRIIDNLISNALKHGTGDLHIIREDARLIFRNGIAEGELIDTSRVFDEFWTTDTSRTSGSTGLGLAIVKQFADILGIGVSASAEDGSFVITLDLPVLSGPF